MSTVLHDPVVTDLITAVVAVAAVAMDAVVMAEVVVAAVAMDAVGMAEVVVTTTAAIVVAVAVVVVTEIADVAMDAVEFQQNKGLEVTMTTTVDTSQKD